MLPMQKKPIQHNKLQTDLAEGLAHDQLYRNQSYQIHSWQESHIIPAKGDRPSNHINCVDTRTSSRAEVLMGLDSFPLYNSPESLTDPIFIQNVKIYSDKIIRYPLRYDDGPRKQVTPTSQSNLTRGLFNGYISKESGRVIRKRLEAWIKSVQINKDVNGKHKNPGHSHIVFATLTLPSQQCHGDNEIKRNVLMPFLQQLKRKTGVGEYFWSAEPQKNGNLHFHVLFDRYIDKDRLNDYWLGATDTLGYYSRYVAATGDINPPSTKINVCPADMSLVKYIMKYVSKQPEIRCSYKQVDGKGVKRISYYAREEFNGGSRELTEYGYDLESHDVECVNGRWFGLYERRPIEGRSWGMSKNLIGLDVFTSIATYRVHDLLTIAEYAPNVQLRKVDHAEIFLMNTHDFMMKHDIVLLQEYRVYYLKLYQKIYNQVEAVKVIPLAQSPPVVAAFTVVKEFKQLRMAV